MSSHNIISGVIVNRSKKPILGVSILVGEDIFYSNKDGNFTLIIPEDSKILIATFSHPSFEERIKPITRNNGKFKTNLGVIKLKSLNESFEDELSKSIPLLDIEIKQINTPNFSFEQFQQKELRDLIKTLKFILIPIILSLLLSFGITKISEALQKKDKKSNNCPSPERLKKIIDKRNKLVKQLDIIFTTVDNLLKALGILQGVLILTEITLNAITPIPLPAPPATPALGEKLDSLVKKFKNINGGLLIILLLLRNILTQILQLLESLDSQIQSCVKDAPELETLNSEIVEQINALNRDSSIPTEKVNGFSFDIETEQTTDSLKRKRAVAKNSKGVILLRGEYSYSSSTKILIEELAFSIKINDLKAD